MITSKDTTLLTATLTTPDADSAIAAERALNAAIVSADIRNSYEEFLAIVDQFYADDVVAGSDSSPDRLMGRARVKSALVGFAVPLHVIAEIGGLSVRVHHTPIASDSLNDQHSEWSLELIGVTGRRVRMTWCVRRRWQHSQVVDEYHYDQHQEGEPLSLSDLRITDPDGLE